MPGAGARLPLPIQQPGPPIMLGGSAPSILELAAAEASVLNIIPPTSNGKDFPNDPIATRRFDMAVMKKKIARLREILQARGRAADAIELGGLLLLGMSRDENDSGLRDMARQLGFDDYEEARRSPVALLGTPSQIRDTLEERIADTGVTYYMMFAADDQSWSLFAKEVLPHFTS